MLSCGMAKSCRVICRADGGNSDDSGDFSECGTKARRRSWGKGMPTVHDIIEWFEAEDFVAARTLCAQLARSGDVQAMQLLGRWHAAGDAGCRRDPGLAA